jgi:hypothetical protein
MTLLAVCPAAGDNRSGHTAGGGTGLAGARGWPEHGAGQPVRARGDRGAGSDAGQMRNANSALTS